MANTLITPSTIAPTALAALYETTAMLPLVWKDLSSVFSTQKIGNTINIRKPNVFVANEFNRATGIVIQDATETMVPVVLNKIADVSFVVTTEDLTLNIVDFDAQFLTPAMDAIAQKIDVAILAERVNFVKKVGAGVLPASFLPKTHRWQVPEVLIDAGLELDKLNVPVTGRMAIVGPTMKANWLDSDIIKHADKSGSTDALRNGSIGKDIFGFETFWSQNVKGPVGTPTAGQLTTEQGLAFHSSAVAFASAPLEVAPGSNAVVRNYKGISLRIAYDYDIKYKQTVVSVDCLYGTKTLDANRGVLIEGPRAA